MEASPELQSVEDAFPSGWEISLTIVIPYKRLWGDVRGTILPIKILTDRMKRPDIRFTDCRAYCYLFRMGKSKEILLYFGLGFVRK
jgi:hypothetical protein